MKKCKRCGKDFTPKNPKGKFCSDKCRVYFGREVLVKNHTEPDKPKDYTKKAAKNESINNYPIGIFERLLAQAKDGTLNIDELDRVRISMQQKDLILRKFRK